MKPVKKTAAALFRPKRDGSLDEPSRFSSRISAAVAILLGKGLLLYARRSRFITSVSINHWGIKKQFPQIDGCLPPTFLLTIFT